ncbi:MAG TPA: lysylphosphatidylglycerol synthase domain-containing protein [Polyangiaceae bacterium]|nr:lysylphosphatidylglycerol synthase domain-containing protein [Polyangiaceae bacterium]
MSALPPTRDRPPAAPGPGPAVAGARVPLWRRLLPWGVAVALLVAVFSRTDARAVWANLRSVNLPAYVAFVALFTVVNLACDSLATWRAYRRVHPALPLRDLLVVRGASYLPNLVNYHVGQAYLTYLLSRNYGVPLLRVVSSTLVIYATLLSNFIVIAAAAMPFMGEPTPWVTTTIVPSAAGVAVYFVALALRPGFAARLPAFTVLFEEGPLGHARLMLWRLPHIAVLSVGLWVGYWFFDVVIPPRAALTHIPVIMLFSALPLTPQGAGMREFVALHLLAAYAGGPAADPGAAILAAGAAWATVTAAMQAVVGLSLAGPAARLFAAATRRLSPPAAPSADAG